MAILRKKNPWQNRQHLGFLKAFIMTGIDAVLSPLEYYEKLEVDESYHDLLSLCFYNSFWLAGPLFPTIFSSAAFLATLFIVLALPVLLFAGAFIQTKILYFWGEQISFTKNLNILAYATPAFVFAMIPVAGYWLAAIVFGVLVSVGFYQICKMSLKKVLPMGLLASLLILMPYYTVSFLESWQKNHPKIEEEVEAQKVLGVIAIAAENYAAQNDGRYPKSSVALVAPDQQYLVRDYCGITRYRYRFSCDFRGVGYVLKAEPLEWKGWGKKTFYITTGGKLRAE